MSFLLLALLSSSPNFQTNDPQLAVAAEAARLRSALFWINRPLAGNWSQPCPIEVDLRNAAAGGATRFLFDRGEVSGWSMTLSGRRVGILANAVPHEVDHMVRATLLRKPILRWLDEGAAALFESASEHERLRSRAIRFATSNREPTFLTATTYPSDAEQMADLYAVGFSLTEFLLRQRDSRRLLELHATNEPLNHALSRLYGVSPPRLIAAWRQSMVQNRSLDCTSQQCLFHASRPHAVHCRAKPCRAANTITIWSATWCGPCRKFWTDYRTDPVFRDAVDARVHIHYVDVDANLSEAKRQRIQSLPTFVATAGRLTGYRGKAEFLGWLESIAPLDVAPPRPSLPARSDSGRRLTAPAEPAITPMTEPPRPPSRAVRPAPAAADGDAPQPRTSSPSSSHRRLYRLAGLAFTAAEWVGVAGAATGPIGVALATIALWKRRQRGSPRQSKESAPVYQRTRKSEADTQRVESQPGPSTEDRTAPFPRELDEARELLRLRQREGRVAALDAIRGMVVDDELDRLSADGHADIADKLRQKLNARVQAIAPITTCDT